jgi:tetratricopeptide (TPR) repeat protein
MAASPKRKGTPRRKAQVARPGAARQHVREVADLAWAGQHAQAIALATVALDGAGLAADDRIDLLERRAESHVAQGELERASEDAAAMIAIAKSCKRVEYRSRAQSLACLVEMRRSDFAAAIARANSALKAARACRKAPLEALGLFRLAEAQFRGAASRAAARNAARAAELYEKLGDPVGQGRASWALAASLRDSGQVEESRKALEAALALARRSGDQYGLGNALNQTSINTADLASCLRLLSQALAAYEASGWLERQGAATANLGILYGRLGLYRRSRRLTLKAGELYRRTNARGALANSLFVLAVTETNMGHRDAARTLAGEAEALIRGMKHARLTAYVPLMLGILALRGGDATSAVRHLKKSIEELGAVQDVYEIVTIPFLV